LTRATLGVNLNIIVRRPVPSNQRKCSTNVMLQPTTAGYILILSRRPPTSPVGPQWRALRSGPCGTLVKNTSALCHSKSGITHHHPSKLQLTTNTHPPMHSYRTLVRHLTAGVRFWAAPAAAAGSAARIDSIASLMHCILSAGSVWYCPRIVWDSGSYGATGLARNSRLITSSKV
jgi:hypothetical protein